MKTKNPSTSTWTPQLKPKTNATDSEVQTEGTTVVTDRATIATLSREEKYSIFIELKNNVEALNAWHEPIPSDQLALRNIRENARVCHYADSRFKAFETTMDEYESSLFLLLVSHEVRSLRSKLGLW